MERAQGFAMQGARVVWTLGYSSTTLVQESAPYATITVYITGTTSLATIYSDNQLPPTPLANPFTANADGYWFFYATDGRYDVRITAPHWDWTIGDVLLQDPFRWTADQNANGHWLNNLGGISFVNGACHESIFLDPNCNLLFTGTGGNTLMSLSPQGDLYTNSLTTSPTGGGVTTPSIHLNNGVCRMSLQFDANCDLEFVNAAGQAVFWVSQQGNTTVQGNLQVDGGFALNGPWLTDQNANGHALTNLGILGVSAIHLNNGTCTAEIGFDAACNVVLYGNLSVDGYLNVVGGAQVDGPFAINGPLSADINANGHSITNLGKLETAQIEFNNGTCSAAIQFDANCNLVVYGNLATSGNLNVGGSINQGGSPLDTGVISVNGLKGEVTLLAGQGIDITATSQDITISARTTYPGITVEGDVTPQRSLDATYQNGWTVPMLVVASVNLGPNDGVIAYTGQTSPPGNQVGVIQSVSQDFTLIMQMTFWVLPGWYYKLDSSLSTNPDWPPFVNKWVEWH